MDRTNIIDADEAARAMAAAAPGKGKGKGRKKPAEAIASSPPKSNKTTAATTRTRSKTPASPTSPKTPTSTQASPPRFYEANGLKIPLYNQNGLGNKKRSYARLSKTLLKYNADELLDIVGQYAGADKRAELKNKGLSKPRLANWIEEKETLALGRNPKSELSFSDDEGQAEPSEDVAPFLAPTIATSPGPNNRKHVATTPTSNNQEDYSPTAAKGDGTFGQSSQRKRSAPDRSLDDQPPAKLPKRDTPANLATINAENSVKKCSIHKPVDDIIPAPPQTDAQTATYNDRDYGIYDQNAFFNSTGMDPADPDRSSMIVRGDDGDRILTATSHETFRGPATYLFETTIPHNAPKRPRASPTRPVLYLKKGIHGRHGDFQDDPDRLTGVGHQIEPDDQLKWNEYNKFRILLYQQFPHYPAPVNGISIDAEMKETWDQWQRWYGEITKKYPGSSAPRYGHYSTYLAYIPLQIDFSPGLITSSPQSAIIKFPSKSITRLAQIKFYNISKATTMSTSLKRTSAETEAEPISMRSNTSTRAAKKPCLSLAIPQKEITKEEQKTLKTRAAAAKRWQPKLKRPFPKQSEIDRSYNLKLMRHYTSTNDPKSLSHLPVIRPHIPKSDRVEKLLATFSILESDRNLDGSRRMTRWKQTECDEAENWILQRNIEITSSELAVRLAWVCFSYNEEDRVDRGRQAMMVSGHDVEDVEDEDLEDEKEEEGELYYLPKRRKANTGRFSRRDSLCD
ncbi:hypothetical protein ACET3X_000080 [Alternaria dauci]|uniref:Uncharacterized protein n=1 Tax=Alternaria dauci TaxID=48095 RepID=A0ABR3UUI8_9PLEO